MRYKVDASHILKEYKELEKRAVNRGKDLLKTEAVYKTIAHKECKVYGPSNVEVVYLVSVPHQNSYLSNVRVNLSSDQLSMSDSEWYSHIKPKMEEFQKKRELQEKEEVQRKIDTLQSKIKTLEQELIRESKNV